MAETNKSQMLSEAEIITAINADSLISVSLGAGQPQKNVKMSTLASVVAGIIRPANVLVMDIQLVANGNVLIDGIEQNTFNGFIAVNSTYSWRGFELYFVSNEQITKLASAPSDIYVDIVLKNGQYYLRNKDSVSPVARIRLIDLGVSIE